MCKRNNISEKDIFAGIKKQILFDKKRDHQYLGINPGEKIIKEMFFQEDGIWKLFYLNVDHWRNTSINFVLDNFEYFSIFIDEKYISKSLDSKLILPLKDQITQFLIKTDFILTYDQDFNSFLSKSHLNNNHPYILMDDSYFGSVKSFVKIILHCLYSYSEKPVVKHRTIDEVIKISNGKNLKNDMASIIEFLLGKSYEMEFFEKYPYSNENQYAYHVTEVYTLCTLFMILHEIGHLVSGHLENDSNPKIQEYTADHFATLGLILFSARYKTVTSRTQLGMIIPLLCSLIRKERFKTKSVSHPDIYQRVVYIRSLIGKDDLKSTRLFDELYKKCILAIKPGFIIH